MKKGLGRKRWHSCDDVAQLDARVALRTVFLRAELPNLCTCQQIDPEIDLGVKFWRAAGHRAAVLEVRGGVRAMTSPFAGWVEGGAFDA